MCLRSAALCLRVVSKSVAEYLGAGSKARAERGVTSGAQVNSLTMKYGAERYGPAIDGFELLTNLQRVLPATQGPGCVSYPDVPQSFRRLCASRE